MQKDTLKSKIAIFLTCMVFYLAFWSGKQVSIDGIVMFQYAKSLLFQHSIFMEPPVVWGTKFVVSRWPIGLTLAYIPMLYLLSKFPALVRKQYFKIPYEPELGFNQNFFTDPAYQYASLIHPLITAISAVFVFDLGRQLGLSKKKSVAAALVFGLASPAAVYTRYDFAQPLASLMILAAIVWLLQARRGSKGFLVLSGFCAGLAVLTRPETIFFPGILLCAAAYFLPLHPVQKERFFSWPRAARLLAVALPLALGVGAVFWWNDLRFDSWRSMGYSGQANSFVFDLSRNIPALVANFISPGRGIFIFFPLSLLCIPGCLRLIRRDNWSGWIIAVFLLGSWLMYSAWYQWGAGLSWGPRFLIPLLPYLAVLSWFGLDSLAHVSAKKRHLAWLALALLGAAACLQGLLFNPLEFYGQFQLTSTMVVDGLYHFNFSMSPVFSGWEYLFQPLRYDNLWIRSISGDGKWFSGLLLLIVLNAASGVYWGKFFFPPRQQTETPGQ